MSSAPLHPSALHCRDLVRRVNPDRALLAELAPEAARPGIWAIAAFDWEVARIPDLVSEPMLGAIRRQWWRDAWAEIESSRPRHHPVVEALAAAHQATPLPMDSVDAYLDAREAEQDGPPETADEMRAQATAIGGCIACLEATTLGQPSQDAVAIGTAWALLGEVRTLPLRLQHGRHGLPADRVAALELGLDSLDPNAIEPGIIALFQDICVDATAGLPSGRGLPALHQGYRHLTLLYGKRLKAAGWNPFSSAINAPTFGRVWSVARVRFGL